jgi:hypothetical protein
VTQAVRIPDEQISGSLTDDQYLIKILDLMEIIQPVLSWNAGLSNIGDYAVGSGFPTTLSMYEQCMRAMQLERNLTEWERSLPEDLVLRFGQSSLTEITRRQALMLRLRSVQ